MRTRLSILLVVAAGLATVYPLSTRVSSLQRGAATGVAVAAPGAKGGQDVFGPYEPIAEWPAPLSRLPGHQGWTFGAGQSIFAESPDRVFVLQRGELPELPAAGTLQTRKVAPSIVFPIFRMPLRDTTVASMPTNGAAGVVVETAVDHWRSRGYQEGVDARWEHCIIVLDREGRVAEAWTQWDAMLQLPHYVTISPYDPEKHVWIVDDHKHVIHKFTHDGKTKVQTIGTPGVAGADATHFNRPTFLDWFADGSFVVADGYYGTRVVKFDRDGRYVTAWGEKSDSASDLRPGHFNNVHGIAIDPRTRRVFVNDRGNHRIQVFDEHGTFLDQWTTGNAFSDVHLIHIMGDGYLWAADRGTSKILKYDLEGHFLYSWGTFGDFPGGLWGVHGMSVDQEGNFYVAEVGNGGVQKFRPVPGANPAFLVGQPGRIAWQ
jgi:DNA-binding beta-propeller fold protein YncE